jgi:hypothetical protein
MNFSVNILASFIQAGIARSILKYEKFMRLQKKYEW